MKDQKVGIKQLLEVSTNLSDLEKRLARAGFNFQNRKDLEIFLRKEWIKANREQILEIKKEPLVELSELPYTEVEREGTKFRIHGIIHNSITTEHPPFLLHLPIPFFQKKKNNRLYFSVKKFMLKSLRKYNNLPKEDYLLEEDFSYHFRFTKKREMKNTTKLTLEKLGLEEFPPTVTGSLGQAILSNFNCLFPKKYDSYGYDEFFKEILKSSNNLKYFSKAKKLFALYKLPEPFNLEVRKNENDFWQTVVVKYSEVLAEYLLSHAFFKPKLKILHAIVGLGHESEIAYFLKTLE